MDLNPLKAVFSAHPRRWRQNLFVYPVVSRRSRGLSVGVNLNPDGACNFDCIYCSVDRKTPRPVRGVDLAVLERELRQLVEARDRLFEEPEFREVPPALRRLNDIAFSGDGEPTAVAVFPQAARLVAAVREDYRLHDSKIVIITNTCYLAWPAVAETLAFLDAHNLEIWAKLDAGTEEYFRLVNRPNIPLQHVLDNILAAARVRPVVLQSLFMRVRGEPPPAAEIAAYVRRLRRLQDEGGRIALVQVYTVARRPAEDYVSPLTPQELRGIADMIGQVGVRVAVFH